MKHTCVYLLLTPDCNLRCRYCFQADTYRRGTARRAPRAGRRPARIGPEVVDAFVDYCVRARAGRVEFFGGEPLLCADMFERAVRGLRRAAPATALGIVTNGTLIDERVMGLLEAEPVSVLLSLDGPRERHDAMRGGFDRIAGWFPRLARLGRVSVALQAGAVPGLYDAVRYAWDQGFRSGVYINVIQSYGWYTPEDVRLFEGEYEKCLAGMLRGEGRLLCAQHLHEMLEAPASPQECGITGVGLACDWQGTLYPCQRAPELGPRFAIGDLRTGLDEPRSERLRARIRRQAYGSESAGRYPLVSYCPVDTYQRHGRFGGAWAREFCEMIELKAKLVAKHHYELVEHFRGAGQGQAARAEP